MPLEFLSVQNGRLSAPGGRPVQLRGVGIGGWLNMENFINGYPGAEHTLRARAAEILGPARAELLFERWLHHFFRPEDVAFVASLGLNAIRIPINYRHLESDDRPFQYREEGWRRIDEAVEWCGRHGAYAILDLHAAPGWQSTDWHSDNASRVALLWEHPHFQDRTVRLWEAIAERFRGNPTVAAYDLLNEPLSSNRRGRLDTHDLTLDWGRINALYRRLVAAVRAVDPDHVIVLEGDYFAGRFAGFDEPPAANLVYSNHPYTPAGFGPGAYPGEFAGVHWDREHQRRWWSERQGVRFAAQHRVPLWAGEFGSVYNGPAAEVPDRLRALDDQIAVFEETGTHWTTWTLKD
ncbi:MAG TPA: cellulase family glycosylhydrolase, partial [Deinococcales bacterium]|nr:cellulase family glycosylhydrolase [Deinococcales bacterium]